MLSSGSKLRRRGLAVSAVLLVKALAIAGIVLLPSGLAISLGAAHGVALLVVAGSAAAALLAARRWRPAERPSPSPSPSPSPAAVASAAVASVADVRARDARRYLTRLSRHAEAISHRPGQRLHDAGADRAHPRMRHVERSGTEATLEFDRGRCVVRAVPDGLALRVEAADAEALRRIEALITANLERFGAREGLTVAWRPDAAR